MVSALPSRSSCHREVVSSGAHCGQVVIWKYAEGLDYFSLIFTSWQIRFISVVMMMGSKIFGFLNFPYWKLIHSHLEIKVCLSACLIMFHASKKYFEDLTPRSPFIFEENICPYLPCVCTVTQVWWKRKVKLLHVLRKLVCNVVTHGHCEVLTFVTALPLDLYFSPRGVKM